MLLDVMHGVQYDHAFFYRNLELLKALRLFRRTAKDQKRRNGLG